MSTRTAMFTEPSSGCTLSANIGAAVTSIVYVGVFAFAHPIIAIENEWLTITAHNPGTKTLTVTRGLWGVGAAHAAGTSIREVSPPANPPARVTIPDTAVPRMQTVWGSTQVALDVAMNDLKERTKTTQLSITKQAGDAETATEVASENVAFVADWP